MKFAVTVLVFCVAALLSLGMVMLYSSSMTQVGAHYLIMQLIWCALGLLLSVTAASIDYRWLKKLAWPLLGVAIVLLALVVAPHIGRKINGAKRWFSLGPVNLQPSEMAKLALILALAWYGEHFQRKMPTFKRGIITPGIFIVPVLALIFIEPDRGSTILLACVCGGMLLLAGVQFKFILPPVVLGATGLAWSLWHDPMRRERILAFLHPEKYKNGVGYQSWQAMIALGSGGWTGLGLGNGRQKLGFVPEHHTDFILSIIGEELGLVATLLVVLTFVIFVICGLYIASRARDTFGLLLASGLTLLIGLQAAINIGVVTSALPNKGLPLPFISYGGSNLLAMLTCVGLLVSVARQSRVEEDLADEPVGEAQTA
ncbi:MAG TPA: putative lipid II flippase FtsW [Verrucomicrobiae bacterium]|jgi:cell division protein FtsW|nr:putative lipid II flippase FtsW [Verrucomicrobiae bacterium]